MKRLLLYLAMMFALPSAAMAQEHDNALEDAVTLRASQIEHVFRGTLPASAAFSATFLQEIPAAKLRALGDQLAEQNGIIQTVDEVHYTGNGSASFDLVYEGGRAEATLQLERSAPYFIAGFNVTSVKRVDDTPQKIVGDIENLPGDVGFGVYMLDGEDGPRSILTNRADVPMAVASSFKLYVLSALVQDIAQGKRRWRDVVALDAPAVPSGKMEHWPVGSPVTLHTLAAMMISQSDNTASDVLIRLLGRERVEAEVAASGHAQAERLTPLLTTMELFAIKAGDPARRDLYAKAAPDDRRQLLRLWSAELTREEINLANLVGSSPNAVDSIEWFASAEDIARVFTRLRDSGDKAALDILAINPSLSDTELSKWDYVGYKGGSEPGVLNYSWLLQDKKGRWFVISASWNNPEAVLDQAALELICLRLVGMLHQ